MNLFVKILSENKVFTTITGAKILAFVQLFLSPIQYLSDIYDAYIAAKRYELTFNGQVIYLEHLLNDKFDPTLRRIFISDPAPLSNETIVIFNIVDVQDSMLLYNIGDSGAANTANSFNIADVSTQYDFILNIPTSLSSQQLTISKTLNAYKEASKYYLITLF